MTKRQWIQSFVREARREYLKRKLEVVICWNSEVKIKTPNCKELEVIVRRMIYRIEELPYWNNPRIENSGIIQVIKNEQDPAGYGMTLQILPTPRE